VFLLRIRVRTPSRLHFGLIDLNGNIGRVDGSLGVALDTQGWLLEADIKEGKYTDWDSSNLYPESIEAIEKIDQYFNVNTSPFKVEIKEALPAHAGLGSTTQFLLALGLIASKSNNLSCSVTEMAKAINRGGTSGIGIAAFDAGGFILDGGHSFGPGKQKETFLPSSASIASPPPVLFRHYPPDNWHFVIICPENPPGAFGKEEINLFQENCPISERDVEKLSRLILMKILPALVENDIHTFGEGITQMQMNFDRFGMDYSSIGIGSELLDFLGKVEKVYGYGVSSFGPSIYGLTDSKENAENLIQKIKNAFNSTKFKFLLSSKINCSGAKVEKIR
jgi:beta-ribofuranosylaminobenzene 5'-phosphate synthase